MKKHILCFGDSNTHGYCADPSDSAEPFDYEDTYSARFNEEERWTTRLQAQLGDQYLVIEEGLSGRTTVFDDPIGEGLCGLDYLGPCLKTHYPISLLIIMLGTNDTKERFCANAPTIGHGMARLVEKAQSSSCWGGNEPKILIIAPPPILEGILNIHESGTMGAGCVEKSRQLSKVYGNIAEQYQCHFLDAGTIGAHLNTIDFMHLTREGHENLADQLANLIPSL
ncbi:MAG: GDSL-type esterase/lipase family protein [Eubacteriales bacterium]